MIRQTKGFNLRLLSAGLTVLTGLAMASQTVQAAETATDWAVGMKFFFSNDDAPGRISEDPLPLTVGAAAQTAVAKMKPPLPPGKTQTNDAGYPLIEAYVLNGANRLYNVQGPADTEGRKVFKIAVNAEETGAKASIALDCANLDPSITLTLVHARTQKKATVSKSSCNNLEDFLEVASATSQEEIFVVGSAKGAGFVGKASDGSLVGMVSSDQKGGTVSGVALTIGGQPVTLNEDGTFKATGVSGLQEVVVRRRGHLTRKVNINLDSAEPLVLPKLAAGDANGDNSINLQDFGQLKKFYQQATNDCYNNPDTQVVCADFDGDGDVDLQDFGILKKNFNQKGD